MQKVSTRDIATTFKEMYDADISATLVSNVTQAVITQTIEWRHQSLDEIYPIVYLDGIVIKRGKFPCLDLSFSSL